MINNPQWLQIHNYKNKPKICVILQQSILKTIKNYIRQCSLQRVVMLGERCYKYVGHEPYMQTFNALK